MGIAFAEIMSTESVMYIKKAKKEHLALFKYE